jgi:hypothetical protein
MTDRELLKLCREAFEAIPVAAKARKMLKELERVPSAYTGNGSHTLCREMVDIISERVGDR